MSNESIRSSDPPTASPSEEESASAVSSGANAVSPRNSTVPNKDETGYESECSTSSRSDADVAMSVLEIEADAYTRFIERQRMDVMYELRRLRLGERPVTGQPNRERIETFINTIHENQQEPTRTPSRRPPVPSAHMADINALASRRCVSAALTSVAFRQDLENTIRQSIGIQTPAPLPSVSPAATPAVPLARVPHAPPLPTVTTREPSPINVESIQTSRITAPPPTPAAVVPLVQRESTPIALNIERQTRELSAWQTITQLQRETIILEISDLVHRQLVSSALESDFRRHLEHNVLRRFEQGAPTDIGEAVPIAPPLPRAAPVPIAAAAAQPRTTQPIPPVPLTSHARLTVSTVDELSSRLDTMQQMLQLMFNMQIDMQRSIRQEVASALTNSRNPTTTAMPVANHPVDSGQCTICLTAAADTVLYRCGHLCVCYTCGLHLQQARRVEIVKCPVCRAPVDDILRVYRSSRDAE